jgi:hypothetical protein
MSHGCLEAGVEGGGELGGGELGGREVGGELGGRVEVVDGLGAPVTLPVQVVPLSANPDGTGLLALHAPLNPKATEAPLVIVALYDTSAAVTADPDWVTVAFHAWVTDCPAVKLQVNRHPLTVSPRLVTVTLAPNPPGHCELIA